MNSPIFIMTVDVAFLACLNKRNESLLYMRQGHSAKEDVGTTLRNIRVRTPSPTLPCCPSKRLCLALMPHEMH